MSQNGYRFFWETKKNVHELGENSVVLRTQRRYRTKSGRKNPDLRSVWLGENCQLHLDSQPAGFGLLGEHLTNGSELLPDIPVDSHNCDFDAFQPPSLLH